MVVYKSAAAAREFSINNNYLVSQYSASVNVKMQVKKGPVELAIKKGLVEWVKKKPEDCDEVALKLNQLKLYNKIWSVMNFPLFKFFPYHEQVTYQVREALKKIIFRNFQSCSPDSCSPVIRFTKINFSQKKNHSEISHKYTSEFFSCTVTLGLRTWLITWITRSGEEVVNKSPKLSFCPRIFFRSFGSLFHL